MSRFKAAVIVIVVSMLVLLPAMTQAGAMGMSGSVSSEASFEGSGSGPASDVALNGEVEEDGLQNEVENDAESDVAESEADGLLKDVEGVLGQLRGRLEEQKQAVDREAYEQKWDELEEDGIKVFCDGLKIVFDVPPVIKEGRTLVPVRALTEALGATVDWNAETRVVTIIKGDITVVLTIDDEIAVVNGREVPLDVPAGIENSRTVVPLRFVSETFDLKVQYYAEGGIVTINSL
ncbi:MAG: copper amine oxidase N-terminal domain-containing protein [Peptococcaceae bacterium]|jgi:hypothetical protein|nr:MAG: copper amine oxidase N-terminal domain-containing protein [Peptococcaceae bacterium]